MCRDDHPGHARSVTQSRTDRANRATTVEGETEVVVIPPRRRG
jgi:hypothetical protein